MKGSFPASVTSVQFLMFQAGFLKLNSRMMDEEFAAKNGIQPPQQLVPVAAPIQNSMATHG
jgi:hypothetical protein